MPHDRTYNRNVSSSSGTSPNVGLDEYETTLNTQIEEVFDTPQDLQSAIINSQAYRDAYNLLSQASNSEYWLAQLRAIPYQQIFPSASFADYFTSNRKDKIRQIYADAMAAIANLVNAYHVHVNSLPLTQVNQNKLAGINSAVSGVGIDASQIPQTPTQLTASSMPSAQPIDVFANAFSVLTASVGGVASCMSALRSFASFKKTKRETSHIDFREMIESGQLDIQMQNLGISRGQLANSTNIALQSVNADLMNRGFVDIPKFDSWDDFNNWWNTKGKTQANSLYIGKNRQSRLYSNLQDLYYTTLGDSLYDVNDFGTNYANDLTTNLVNAVVTSRLDTFRSELEYQRALAEYNALYQLSLDPEALAKAYQDKTVFDAELARATATLQDLEVKRGKLTYEQIMNWYDAAGDDPVARAALAQVLNGINVNDLIVIDNYGFNKVYDVGSKSLDMTNQAINAVEGATNIFNPFK